MIITLTIVALLIQFGGLYVLLHNAQRAQDSVGQAVKPQNRRSQQVYYNAFVERRAKPRASQPAA